MKIKAQRLAACLCILALLLTALPFASAAEPAVQYRLPVLETSDVHGYLVDTSGGEENTYAYRMAYIAKAVNDRRVGGDPATTLLLDGGDIYQGQVVSNLNNGEPLVAAYAAMQYDAVALGNHEFDWGVTTLCDSDGTMSGYSDGSGAWTDAKVPVVCSNLYDAGTTNRVNFTKDYVILDKTATATDGSTLDVQIAVIGYAEDYSSSIMTSKIAPYTIDDSSAAVAQVKSLAASLKSSGQADAVVVLSHAGASGVAAQFSGSEVDLVCGGHSHSNSTGTSGSVAYIQPAAQGQAYAYAELNFSTDGSVSVSGQWTYSVSDADCRLGSGALDADVLAISRSAVDAVSEQLNTVIGYITKSIINSDTSAGNFICDLMNSATGSQAAFTNSGGIRTTFQVDGATRNITVGDIYTMMPFCNILYIYDVTYEQLADAVMRRSVYMSGVDLYYSGGAMNALVVNGKCIYKNGTWADGWRTAHTLVSVNEFVATGYRPFTDWNAQGLLVDSTTYVDNETFVAELQRQTAKTDGLIVVDETQHRINGSYSGSLYEGTPCAHQYQATVTAPTCTEKGFTTHTCTLCGDSFEDTYVDALGHEWDEGKITTAPTETQYGVKTYTCSRCGETKTEEVPVADCPSAQFTDVDTGKWYHEAVDFVVANDLMKGISDTTFEPNSPMTRGMLVTILYRAEGEPDVAGIKHPFTDVADRRYFTKPVAWAYDNDIVKGITDTTFEPDTKVSREQLATILFRYAEAEAVEEDHLKEFPDAEKVHNYAKTALNWAVAEGLITGNKTGDVVNLDPRESATRAQIATILMRYLQNAAE